MPAMRVCELSSSVLTRKVGSSSARRCRAIDILSWSALVFGSTASSMTGSGKLIVLEHDRLRLVAQRVAGGRVLQPHRGGDVAGADRLDLFAVIRVQLQQAADALLVPLVELYTYDPVLRVPE